jgi:hypothetical protein
MPEVQVNEPVEDAELYIAPPSQETLELENEKDEKGEKDE